jgi:dihydrofolate reductase
MKTIVYIAQSLDGFIAKKDGDITWLEEFPNPDGSDFGFSDFMKKIDALLMGRNTYEKVLTFGFWPYEKPVYVISNTIKVVPENLEGKVFIVRGEILEILESLENKGLKSIYVDGGKLIQSFLSEDLIDTMIITTMPVILGEGLPLFASIGRELKWDLVESQVLNKYAVKSEYSRKK